MGEGIDFGIPANRSRFIIGVKKLVGEFPAGAEGDLIHTFAN